MIKIKEDYRYFTHLLGKESVIPLSKAWMKVFPSRIEVYSEKKSCIIELKIVGPIKGFTHLLNIEEGRGEIFGSTKEGYFHLFISAYDGKVFIKLHRGTKIVLSIDGKETILNKGDKIDVLDVETMKMPDVKERISFGCSKKPELGNGLDRKTKLYLLAQMIPEAAEEELDISQVEILLIDLFCPKAEDLSFSGVKFPKIKDRFTLFSSFLLKYRKAIINESNEGISLLQNSNILPHAGRALNLKCKGCTIDLLWKKGKVIKAIIHPLVNCEKLLIFPKGVKSFRIKKHPKEKGVLQNADEPLLLQKSQTIYIDRING